MSSASQDLDQGIGRVKVYVICTVQRSGSTVFCEAVHKTNSAGYPAEYFDDAPSTMAFWRKHFRCESGDDLFDKIVQGGSTKNGVFGIKLHLTHLEALRKALTDSLQAKGIEHSPDDSLDTLLKLRLGDVRYVWLRRDNKVLQGISHFKAVKTGIWSSEGKNDDRMKIDQGLAFDGPEIDRHVKWVTEQDAHWGHHFKINAISPLTLVYEDFVKDPKRVLTDFFDHLDIPTEGIAFDLPPRERQSDHRSKAWEERYRQGQQGRAPSTQRPDAARPAPAAPTQNRSEGGAIPLTAYLLNPDGAMKIEPASARRAWMDQTSNRFAYRCLPLALANQAGWVLLNRERTELIWNGSNGLDAMTIVTSMGRQAFVKSHFGHGIITFLIPYLFRTPPGYNLLMRGPANHPKDGIAPLEGLIEADWTQAGATMNWRMTRPETRVVFEKDEPIAMLVPMRRGELEAVEPHLQAIADHPALHEGYQRWAESRKQFNEDLANANASARKQGWQKHYMQGVSVTNEQALEHQTKLDLKPFPGF